jgi:hypothetical protein
MAAPLKNRFALGNNGGQPAYFETPEQMIEKASEYFEMETQGNGICKPTITGLIFHLGFESRTSWYQYKERSKEFLYTINRMQTFVESCYEKNLHGFAFAGSIFALKNINKEYWKDKIESEVNQTNHNVQASFGSALQSPSESVNDSQLDKE